MLKDHYRVKQYATSKGDSFSVERVTYKKRKETVVEAGRFRTRNQANEAKKALDKGPEKAPVASEAKASATGPDLSRERRPAATTVTKTTKNKPAKRKPKPKMPRLGR